MKFILFFVFAVVLAGILTIPSSSAQDVIPSWIKNNAGWWASDKITENEFLRAIEYLIKNDIVVITDIPTYEKPEVSIDFSYTKLVPDWIKNNAGWWADGQIDDGSFVSGIQWLISNDIIQIEVKKITNQTTNDPVLASGLDVKNSELVFYYSDFFNVYCFKNAMHYGSQDGKLVPICSSSAIALNPNNMNIYHELAIWDEPQKTAVVYPIFTASAYQGSDPHAPAEERGFYPCFNHGHCDGDWNTVKIISDSSLEKLTYSASGMGIQVLSLLGYTPLTDVDIDQNPNILKEFDTIVMLHNEYVTRTMFDAITSHPNVIYLYPNALYGEIEVNYTDETITLIRGHNYPEPEIKNGFDWKFENTHPYEFDNTCVNMEFYKIENGWMLNCYPDVLMKESRILLAKIKNLVYDNDFEKSSNVEKQLLLDWDTIVNDSKYAYDGSIRLQSKFFDYVNYTVKYDASKGVLLDLSEPTLLRASTWLYQITGNEIYLQNAGRVADIIEDVYLYQSGIVIEAHPFTKTVKVEDGHTNRAILPSVAKLALLDSNYIPLTKTLADAIMEHEINHKTELFYGEVTLDGKPVDTTMYMSYGGSVSLESLLLAYEATSDKKYLDQVKRTILAYWDLRDKETNLIPSWVNAETKSIKEPFMQQYGAGIFLKVLLHYYYLTEDKDVYKIIEDYTDAVVHYFWDGKTWNYRVDYDGKIRSNIIEANYGKLDDALFLVYDLNPARFQKAYDLAKLDYDFSFQDKTSMVNGLVTHSVKDDGSRESIESMMNYAFLINQNVAVRLYQDTMNPEYIEAMKDFYEKVISHHKREYGYIYGVNAYTLEDTELGTVLNQRAVGMIANKINLSFVPSDNVKVVWTKIGNFELTEPFIVHFNEPGRFNAIKFDYNEKSIFFETIENEGTVTFSSGIKNVLVDGQNYSNFNEKTLNTLKGKHDYKVTLVD